MYKTLENAIRSIQKDALDEELGKASKKRMEIKAVAREEDARDGEVPTRQGEIQKKVVDEAEEKKKINLSNKVTPVIMNPEMGTEGSANQMKEEKDEREYGYEGEMATSQLKSIIQNAEAMLGMLQDGTDLPEWVQSKITLAQDYIMSAKDYLSTEMSEEIEQVDEGKWDYPKSMTRPRIDSYLGKTGQDERAARKAWRKKIKAKQHKELMIGKQRNEEVKQIDEKLKGNQHKLDAHDFELLRKKNKFAESNGVTDSLLDAVKSVVEARKPNLTGQGLGQSSMQKALDAAAKQKKLQDTLAGKSLAFAPKKEPEVKKEEIEQVDGAFVVYHKKNKNIESKHSNHATAKKHAEKRGDDFAVASHEYWQDKIKPMKEEVEQVNEKITSRTYRDIEDKRRATPADPDEPRGTKKKSIDAARQLGKRGMGQITHMGYGSKPDPQGRRVLHPPYVIGAGPKGKLPEEVELSDDELARLESIAKKFD